MNYPIINFIFCLMLSCSLVALGFLVGVYKSISFVLEWSKEKYKGFYDDFILTFLKGRLK